jgi:hypothetical protein
VFAFLWLCGIRSAELMFWQFGSRTRELNLVHPARKCPTKRKLLGTILPFCVEQKAILIDHRLTSAGRWADIGIQAPRKLDGAAIPFGFRGLFYS